MRNGYKKYDKKRWGRVEEEGGGGFILYHSHCGSLAGGLVVKMIFNVGSILYYACLLWSWR